LLFAERHFILIFLMGHYLFTSESVGIGHPDKIADQISDAVLDACLEQDPLSRVACETLVCPGLVMMAGEVTTTASLSYIDIARQTIKKIGYDNTSLGFDYHSCGVLVSIQKQSPDIALGVDASSDKELGAGDQGIMFGYACDETAELMPLPIMLAHKIVRQLRDYRDNDTLAYLGPDSKAQITVEYSQDHRPLRVDAIVISTQHHPDVGQKKIHEDMRLLAKEVVPAAFIDEKTKFYINPTGRFVIGGPAGDCGLTGRKIIVDTYGGMGRHGGGAFSGKDPTKVDRSACYAARYVAKNIVAARLASRCEVQLSYAIGIPHPISIKIDTFGTGTVSEDRLAKVVPAFFNLTPQGIIDMLDLRRPIYLPTAFGGHFGRQEPKFTWESTDQAAAFEELARQ
jgi:S-adenosylmethionine synthetase